jgi:hypothetical protein
MAIELMKNAYNNLKTDTKISKRYSDNIKEFEDIANETEGILQMLDSYSKTLDIVV